MKESKRPRLESLQNAQMRQIAYQKHAHINFENCSDMCASEPTRTNNDSQSARLSTISALDQSQCVNGENVNKRSDINKAFL